MDEIAVEFLVKMKGEGLAQEVLLRGDIVRRRRP